MTKKYPWSINLASFIVTVILLISGICISYGSLSQKVEAAEKDICDIQAQFAIINQKLDSLLEITTEVKTKVNMHTETQ